MLKSIETSKFPEYVIKYFERNIKKGKCKFKYIPAKFVKIEKTNIKFHFPFQIIIYNDNEIKTILYTGKDEDKKYCFYLQNLSTPITIKEIAEIVDKMNE